jgi:hypothetical protein
MEFAGGFEVRYAVTDPARQNIPWVERRKPSASSADLHPATADRR